MFATIKAAFDLKSLFYIYLFLCNVCRATCLTGICKDINDYLIYEDWP